MIYAALSDWKLYPFGEAWKLAMSYLETLDEDSEVANFVPLDDDAIFARVMEYPTKPRSEGRIEAHKNYCDIQMSLKGAERIDCYPRHKLALETPYSEDNDVMFFQAPDVVPASNVNRPGFFSVFLPNDGHMPQLNPGEESDLVKKVVVKVHVSRLLPEMAAS